MPVSADPRSKNLPPFDPRSPDFIRVWVPMVIDQEEEDQAINDADEEDEELSEEELDGDDLDDDDSDSDDLDA